MVVTVHTRLKPNQAIAVAPPNAQSKVDVLYPQLGVIVVVQDRLCRYHVSDEQACLNVAGLAVLDAAWSVSELK